MTIHLVLVVFAKAKGFQPLLGHSFSFARPAERLQSLTHSGAKAVAVLKARTGEVLLFFAQKDQRIDGQSALCRNPGGDQAQQHHGQNHPA